MFQRLPFPFANGEFPQELGAGVQRTILRGEEPARTVVHTADGSWLVGDGVHDPNEPGAAIYTHIWHAIESDPSIAGLATMPPGTEATREGPGDPWKFEPHEWPDEDETP
jgi:hypothetical protein